ncbi:unnamed protein product [Dicrocoelium dendriticum]|nr:unnamed protein product [Dicrocoelium dendriticum]
MVSLVGSASAPDEVEDVNYDAVPVEKFGLAVLAGMGFNPEELKSTKDEPLGPTRPKGLGLGADPHAVRAARQDSKSGSGEQLSWSPGAHCQAILGKHKGQYGIVNGIDGDTGRVVVKFTISKEIVPILQPMLRLVRKEEYNKYANCLNQADVDRYKAEEHDSSAASTIQPTLNGKSADSRLRETSSELSSASKRKDPHSWIRSNLIVRFLDKHYHHGRYYKHKVKVIGVDSNRCTCQTEDGRIIEGWSLVSISLSFYSLFLNRCSASIFTDCGTQSPEL